MTSFLALLLLCVVAWLVVRFGVRWLRTGATRYHGAGGGGAIRTLAHVSLDARHRLHVIAVADKTLLLATGERGVHLLTELDGDAVARALATEADAGQGSFHALYTAALARAPWFRARVDATDEGSESSNTQVSQETRSPAESDGPGTQDGPSAQHAPSTQHEPSASDGPEQSDGRHSTTSSGTHSATYSEDTQP